ncbi:MAG TPA: NIPSNAP family protein [Acidimicrobiia bacterium]|nr:NIPSNAP family protein [Acidimicrobiia bacterium]
MLLEIRTYTLHPGKRPEFVAWFEEEVAPAMEAAGMSILGSFESIEDDDVFVYLRRFVDEDERTRLTAAFYSSDTWLSGMRDRALALESGYEVRLVRSTPRSQM